MMHATWLKKDLEDLHFNSFLYVQNSCTFFLSRTDGEIYNFPALVLGLIDLFIRGSRRKDLM
jgi:hypothetical protein